jgi:protein gp37
MALAPQHSFQILTKRPERMAEYMNGPVRARSIAADVNEALDGLEKGQAYTRALDGTAGMLWGDNPDNASWRKNAIVNLPWPLPNVWLGTSVEDQAAADERIPHLLQTPAAVRFLSCEPLIGPVDLRVIEVEDEEGCTLLFPLDGEFTCEGRNEPLPIRGGGIHWVIVGGESGPKARPCDVAWIRSLVAPCRAAGVPAFFKQGGAHNRCIHDAKGGCMDCTPFDLRVREFPHGS